MSLSSSSTIDLCPSVFPHSGNPLSLSSLSTVKTPPQQPSSHRPSLSSRYYRSTPQRSIARSAQPATAISQTNHRESPLPTLYFFFHRAHGSSCCCSPFSSPDPVSPYSSPSSQMLPSSGSTDLPGSLSLYLDSSSHQITAAADCCPPPPPSLSLLSISLYSYTTTTANAPYRHGR